LLRSAEQLWRRGVEFSLVLAGPEMPNFRSFVADFPFAARVRRLGVLTESDKRNFFAGLDVFALPSRSDSFGLVLLEAWANGLPNVVCRAGGPADLVSHEHDGLVVKCGDVCELADALARLVGDAHLRQVLGVSGRVRVQAEFAWEDKLELVRNVITEVVKNNPAVPASSALAGAAG
jgi:glycosyltransferase involved in cell wall biosynthesis